jgi:hypothetical protein
VLAKKTATTATAAAAAQAAATKPVPVVDPSQSLDRQQAERRRRLAKGGTQSTILGRSIEAGSGTPAPLLKTGV